jgi:hypothetical protein
MSLDSQYSRYPNIYRFHSLAWITAGLLCIVGFVVSIAVMNSEMPGIGRFLTVIAIVSVVAVACIIQFAGSEALIAIAKNEINTEAAAIGINRLNDQVQRLATGGIRNQELIIAALAPVNLSATEPNKIGPKGKPTVGHFVTTTLVPVDPLSGASPTLVNGSSVAAADVSPITELSGYSVDGLEVSVKYIHAAKTALAQAGYEVKYLESGETGRYVITHGDTGKSYQLAGAAELIGFAKTLDHA